MQIYLEQSNTKSIIQNEMDTIKTIKIKNKLFLGICSCGEFLPQGEIRNNQRRHNKTSGWTCSEAL